MDGETLDGSFIAIASLPGREQLAPPAGVVASPLRSRPGPRLDDQGLAL
jgi:hypothetical protein